MLFMVAEQGCAVKQGEECGSCSTELPRAPCANFRPKTPEDPAVLCTALSCTIDKGKGAGGGDCKCGPSACGHMPYCLTESKLHRDK